MLYSLKCFGTKARVGGREFSKEEKEQNADFMKLQRIVLPVSLMQSSRYTRLKLMMLMYLFWLSWVSAWVRKTLLA